MLIGYQAVYDTNFFSAIDYAKESGFDYVSFDLNVPRFYIDQLDRGQLTQMRNRAESTGVGLAFHAPGDNISLFSDYASIRNGILEHFRAIIGAAEELGARHVTIHTGAYPSLKQAGKKKDDFIAQYRDYFAGVLRESLLHLANETRNVLLCVENFHFTALTMDTVERALMDSDRLFLGWDIAKTYDMEIQLDQSIDAFMRRHLGRVREIHVHDIIRGFRSHQIVGDGGIHFRSYLELMASPDVAATIEVRPREAAALSKDRLIAIFGQCCQHSGSGSLNSEL